MIVKAGSQIRSRKSGELFRVVTAWQNTNNEPTLIVATSNSDGRTVEVWRDQMTAYEAVEQTTSTPACKPISNELRMSDCDSGCKIYRCACGTEHVFHNRTYGCTR